MELESLKYLWHSLKAPGDVETGSTETRYAEIRSTETRDAETRDAETRRLNLIALLARRSRGPIARMRRNLIGEAVALLVAYLPAILWCLFESQGKLTAISCLFALLAAFFFTYYYRKYRLLQKIECPGFQVRANLVRQVATLKKYTGFYLVAGTALVPFSYLLTYFIIRWQLPAAGPALYVRLHPVPWWSSPGFGLALLIPLTIVIYYINAWYINKLYGGHIKKLQELLFEMEAE